MIDDRELFERAVERFAPPERSFERLLTRRDRKHRNKRITAGVVALVVAAAGTGALIRAFPTGSTPADDPTQPPSPFTEKFDSPVHGLSIGYPSGWRTRAATEPWGHDAVAFGAPDVDVIFDPTLRNDLYFAVVSEPLGGKSGPDWVDAYLLPSVGICTGPGGGSGGAYTLDGADGWAQSCGSHLAGGHVVTVATATRGYIIYLHVGDERLLQATYDWDWFEAALETVDLHPEDALDALNPSQSP